MQLKRERGSNSGYTPGCNGRSDRVAGFPVAGGGSMSAVSEVGRKMREGARAHGGDECMGFGLGAVGIPTGP